MEALKTFGNPNALDVVIIEELELPTIDDNEAIAILNREKFSPSLDYPLFSTKVPLALIMRAKIPGSWDAGQRTLFASVRTADGYESQVPIEVKIVDSYSTARTTLTGMLGALLTATLIWIIVERRKLAYQSRRDLENERKQFFKCLSREFLNRMNRL